MYFANRCQLAMIGVPIVCDNFKAWKFGPVPAFTGSVIKCFENETPLSQDMKIFRNVLRVRRNKLVKGLATPDVESLPALSRQILDDIIRQCKYKSWKDLSKMSHDAAWSEAFYNPKTNRNGGTTIQPYLMAAVEGANTAIQESVLDLYNKNSDCYTIWSDSRLYDAWEQIAMQLHSLLSLKEDWDGDGAFPISEGAAFNCRRILSRRQSEIRYIADIYPTPAGNICIDWNIQGRIVSAEVSSTQIGFYYEDPVSGGEYDSQVVPTDQSSYDLLFHYIEKCFDDHGRACQ